MISRFKTGALNDRVYQCRRQTTQKTDEFAVFYVFLTVHHSIELFRLPTLMHNSLFINKLYVTLLSSTCFEH